MIKYDQLNYLTSIYGSGRCIISGIIYQFSYSPKFCIVAFDIKSEIFTTIRIDNSIDMYDFDYMLRDVNGKLEILNISEFELITEDIHLWIFEKEWEHQIFQFPLEWKHDVMDLRTYLISKYGDDEIVFAINIISSDVLVYIFYHVKNQSWRYFKVEELSGLHGIFTCSESIFPLENSGLPTTILEKCEILV
ncbi:hypothetical protein R3W88_007855 [Solanum pinnatisectum]|uniref:F-box associated beta-propeller type 3 domain-containing protein n=1 Tax=Solanum pinnatisectum TaxID=50273 RepID=A0AAV9M9K3_9SOLN|nr:hypothetical protein R3W88_007855 [Solanum pinnatisectum]